MATAQYTPLSPVGKCKSCAKNFIQDIGRGKCRSYCQKSCIPPKAQIEKTCDKRDCGNRARSSLSPYCEKHYYQVRRNGSLGTKVDRTHHDNCQHCGAVTGGPRHCSARCATRTSRGLRDTSACASCGIIFSPIDGNTTCSTLCLDELRRKRARARYAIRIAEDPDYKDKVRSAEYKRKSMKRNAYVEDVKREEVMLRSRWICHLCKSKIPKSAVWPDQMFGTVDHVLPLVHGGKHSYANCKAAHLRCNCSKGPRPIGQLGIEF